MPAKPSSFFWYELMTTDVAAAETFYKAVVGWNSEPFGGGGMDYIIMKAGDRGVTHRGQAHWVFRLLLCDIELSQARFRQGKLRASVFRVMGHGRRHGVVEQIGCTLRIGHAAAGDQIAIHNGLGEDRAKAPTGAHNADDRKRSTCGSTSALDRPCGTWKVPPIG